MDTENTVGSSDLLREIGGIINYPFPVCLVVYSKQPKLGLTQEFVVRLMRMR